MAIKFVPNMDQASFLMRSMCLWGNTKNPNPKCNDPSYTGLESGIEYDTKAIGEGQPFFEW